MTCTNILITITIVFSLQVIIDNVIVISILVLFMLSMMLNIFNLLDQSVESSHDVIKLSINEVRSFQICF